MSTVNLACPLNLKAIALQARNAEYNPKVRFYCSLYMQHYLELENIIFIIENTHICVAFLKEQFL